MARRQDPAGRRGARPVSDAPGQPVFIVHDFECACAALRAAQEAGVRIVLRSPPGAIHAHGLGYLMALFEEARVEVPDAAFDFVIDCDDDAAKAHRALASGIERVVFRGHPAARRRLESVARQLGATLLGGGTPEGACALERPETAAKDAADHLKTIQAGD